MSEGGAGVWAAGLTVAVMLAVVGVVGVVRLVFTRRDR